MCGRFTLTTAPELIAEAFSLDEPPSLSPRINISPTEEIGVIRGERPRVLAYVPWGFANPKGRPLINARAEGLHERPSFRDAFMKRRCLVPADGFYEWPTTEAGKHAVWIRRPDRAVFAFAGLIQAPGPDGKEAVTLVTTAPTPALAWVHDRMPVILGSEDYSRWLDPKVTDTRPLQRLLVPPEGFPLEVTEAPRLGRDVR